MATDRYVGPADTGPPVKCDPAAVSRESRSAASLIVGAPGAGKTFPTQLARFVDRRPRQDDPDGH